MGNQGAFALRSIHAELPFGLAPQYPSPLDSATGCNVSQVRGWPAVSVVLVLLAAALPAGAAADGPQRQSFVRLDRVTAARALPNGIEVRAGGAILEVTALRDDVLRVRAGAAGQLPEDASWAVLPEARSAGVPVHAVIGGSAVEFKTRLLTVRINKDPF